MIGASESTSSLSGRPLRILQQHGYWGRLYPVNPHHDELLGIQCYPAVTDLPEIPDLAVLLVKASLVPGLVDSCASTGIRNVVVVSSGFAEQSNGGASRRDELLGILTRYPDLQLAGPNAEGFINTYGPVPVTFSPTVDYDRALDHLFTGPIAVVAQSGGLGFAFFNDGQHRRLGFSYVVSTGNEDGLSVLDFVDYLVDDPKTGVLLLFVEGLRNGDQLREIAGKAATARKPIVVAKVGRSQAGQRAAESHTAHLAGRDEIYSALFRQYGIIRAEDQEELVDLGMAFSWASLPKGDRVVILTFSGGTGVWVADALEAEGFEMPQLSPELQQQVQALIPAYGWAANPVDVTAQVIQTAGGLAPVLDLLVDSDEFDAIVVATTLSSPHLLRHERDALGAAVGRADKPVIIYGYTGPVEEVVEILAQIRLPWFTSGRRVARALRALRDYGNFLARRRPQTFVLQPTKAPGARVGDSGPWIEWRAKAALRAAGLPVPAGEVVRGVQALTTAAERIGYPVAVKAQSALLAHKTEAGAVALDLENEVAVRAAVYRIVDGLSVSRPDLVVREWLVERMCPGGIEMIVGVLRDPVLGPAVVLGFGGIYAEVLRDSICLPAPITLSDVRHGIERLRGSELLRGARGQEPSDVDALAELIVAIGDLAVDHPEIVELDLNPVVVGPLGQGVCIVDANGRLSD